MDKIHTVESDFVTEAGTHVIVVTCSTGEVNLVKPADFPNDAYGRCSCGQVI